jgi:hypothetical protein
MCRESRGAADFCVRGGHKLQVVVVALVGQIIVLEEVIEPCNAGDKVSESKTIF